MTGRPSVLTNLRDIASGYRGIILDLFGTVHDGLNPLDGAIDALRMLRRGEIAVCLLSNSPRRREDVAARLAQMGFAPELYRGLVTSGELAFEALSNDANRDLGRRFFHIGPPELSGLFDGSGRERAEAVDQADFLLCTGASGNQALEEAERVLGNAQVRGLVMVCANPDHAVMVGKTRVDCAGTIAAHYECLGGTVLYYGKPLLPAYDRALSVLGLARDHVLAIGDGLETDIVGARRAGMDAALVLTGIHHDQIVNPKTGHVLWGRLARLCLGHERLPDFVMPAFTWGRRVQS
ncbi:MULTISPECIES: TIGR01459 family HAD-type hydrolase [Rhizobium]|uniref:HAD-superfamily subfamily IIA hydrolase like protein n=1 Tax=Rhizobium favelukesii TaxID=348824 RepID=W6RR57_9HYPH|nr:MULTISPECIES: TIGR01459 family HAD-type hydrolase [Rhizobium]MCA0806583.1 TIGR01459 family HAD-type hydrolase [Rhizobium sp. T1473]MCS0459788.1 TIGR01459 family HAD-type hydrolase [Rhizobium favelukesii]UFS85314.1 TIGR01459 family HAD-type hydrolase [Rhizobium sp. T136]CDM61333.1 HAD-superfamily subfamily IIA hydrolase like protein [Rhizobium favelukesii]